MLENNINITFVTSNLGKVEEVSRYLDLPIEHISLDIPEIQSLDLEEIVREKARRAFEELQKPLLIEDVSLVFNSLGKLPGPLIKWFEKELGCEGLCSMLKSYDDKSCIATVCYAFYTGKEIYTIEAEMEGVISSEPRGSRSFGWSPIFIPKGMDKTYAELTENEQSTVSFRKKALEKLKEIIGNEKVDV